MDAVQNTLNVQQVKLEDLKPYENNPRNNSEAIEKVAESIKQFGFQVPIVIDRHNVIAAGHTRYEAAKMLGLTSVPCVVADKLTDKQIKAFRLADNKVGEIATWDFGKLNLEIAELSDQFNFSDFGFNAFGNEFSTDQQEDAEDRVKVGVASDNYSITYEIAFNDEDEQTEWYDFISAVKKKFPDYETISQRVLAAAREWKEANGL